MSHHPALDEAIEGWRTQHAEAFRADWLRRAVTLPHAYPDVDPDAEVERHLAFAAKDFTRWQLRTPERYRDAHLADLRADQHEGDLRSWLDGPSSTLLIYGPSGRGKTHAAHALLALAAARAALGYGKTPRAWTVPGLLNALRSGQGDAEDTWAAATTAPVVLLDDLAAVRVTDWAYERVWMLVDARTSAGLRQVVTTNAPWLDLEAQWGVPTMDRLRDRSSVIKLLGDNLRKPLW